VIPSWYLSVPHAAFGLPEELSFQWNIIAFVTQTEG
jgi:hypothetical protein